MALKWEIHQFQPPFWIFQNGGKWRCDTSFSGTFSCRIQWWNLQVNIFNRFRDIEEFSVKMAEKKPTLRSHSMETIENSQAISVSQTVRVVSYQMAVKWEIRQFWPPSWVFQNGGKGVIWHIIFRYFSVPNPMVKSRRKYLQPLPRYWGILGQDGWKTQL